ncbi:mannose-6-phosphate isomerase ManA [Clostridium pasteurianum DSM 525 = ATCC 6013]|uniref:Phosphohexomutase n=1 Tax=Clostridium pasteurianum DSM 525 = ATCC 6013 TaxID=1262449 RepID=A0A0H3J285_CLOPA|nr:type I phosphomannose isomerase catalytic subunit [Clostridium pasteurianum]AJA47534.1 mannose-6-phosphate isomerase ManA [Clostridium pasteurianum DSM 525 = ATCC 6013]AJA51522.1 mannose-6-phosphate isomerase ManA [Clostridium pasteurianum DSM 525 = ATCC 6013]AOZ74851.1 mannose-6-phosphate isomerase [Clostridium pasteurianum DSM 525 = ATCC 6013]AOZ78646.1 mannose-6-phosphate isomerase [Clostridium pasteurianum]ELP57630.1 mannose-6-phosphate isomerase [Clostridium pasteurianum DSM 525 = ATCC
MYPLKFENLYYEKIWGGRDLKKFRDNLPEGNIGESWDIACHEHGMSIVSNGKYKNLTLGKLIELEGEKILGDKIDKNKFPLLIKLINAKDKLSVQVHPDDKYARRVEGELGKTEIWYVVEAFEGANLVVGTKDCTQEQFKSAISNGDFDKYLNKVNVKKGEVYFVKSGLVHAIGQGVIIAEIQQNSDTTYRVYDYNRGRELHIDKAMDVINFTLTGEKSRGLKVENENYNKIFYSLCDKFSLELYEIKCELKEESDRKRFYIFTCVEGEGKIYFNEGEETITCGESILIPAYMGSYKIKGKLKILKSYVPDVEKVEKEIIHFIER